MNTCLERRKGISRAWGCWNDFGHEMPISHIRNRFPATAKMKGDIYHLSCLLHSYIDDVSKLLTNYTKNLVRQKKKKKNIKMP